MYITISLGTILFTIHLFFSLNRKSEQSTEKQIRTSRAGLGSTCGDGSAQQKPMFPGDWPHPRPPSSGNHPSYLLWSVSWHRFSIAWISSRIRQPRLRKDRKDVAYVMTFVPPKRERSPGSQKLLRPSCLHFPYRSALSHRASCSATCGSWEASPSAQTWCRAPVLGSGYYPAVPTRIRSQRAYAI